MTFSVTYRGADGALREEAIEAASRTECFAQCKARGIAPVGVKEKARKDRRQDGGSPSQKRSVKYQAPGTRHQALTRAAILAAMFLVAIGGAWWWLSKCEMPPQNEKSRYLSPAEKPNSSRQQTLRGSISHDNSSAIATSTSHMANATMSASVEPKAEVISVVTNKAGYVVERVRNPDGTTSKRVSAPPPIFRNTSDQMIALAISAQPGQALPPMPVNAVSDEDFMKSLEDPIEILDDDSPDVKDLKAKVIIAREDIKAMMKKGYSALQVLEEHHQLYNDNAKLYADALVEMNAILTSGDRAGARQYAENVNAAFRQMGVSELPIPSKDGEVHVTTRSERLEIAKEKARQGKEKTDED